ncbi:hypothetical protein LIA77_03105 [Sarocladium implicatum]|nr:hypothetical protein LIA77_03105 [Sarocladium implicatum]
MARRKGKQKSGRDQDNLINEVGSCRDVYMWLDDAFIKVNSGSGRADEQTVKVGAKNTTATPSLMG